MVDAAIAVSDAGSDEEFDIGRQDNTLHSAGRVGPCRSADGGRRAGRVATTWRAGATAMAGAGIGSPPRR